MRNPEEHCLSDGKHMDIRVLWTVSSMSAEEDKKGEEKKEEKKEEEYPEADKANLRPIRMARPKRKEEEE